MNPSRRMLAAVPLAALLVATAQPSQVEEIVEGVEHRYNRVRTLEADFVQRYTLGALTRVESGHVYFQKPGRMRWEYESPEKKLFLTDNQYAYLYVPREQQVRRQPLKKAGEWQATFALLVGRIKLKRLFQRVQLVRVHRLESPARWQLRGQPRSDKQAFREIWIDLNERYQVLRIEVRQRDGSLMEFHFRRWQENGPLPADLFRLRLPPGTAWLEEAPS